jgi:hypothetical protein
MKKLKKGLSLLLVLAMVFSLATTAFAGWDVSKYEDADKITQDEAVAVLSGLGIIEGDETTGNLNPDKTYTRAAAAKVLTYMLLGPENAEALPDTSSKFTDVETGKWYTGVINYLAEQGIVSGYGDGRFGPDKPVTQDQWLKMLLCAMGYDEEKAGMGDTVNWAVNARSLAMKKGLVTAAQLKLDWNRETAILNAYTAITLNKNLADSEDTDPVFAVTVNSAKSKTDAVSDKTTGTTDDFGRPTAEYKADGAEKAYATYVADPELTYEDQAVAIDDIKKALDNDKATFSKIEDGDVPGSETFNFSQEAVGGKGSTVEVYAIDAKKNQYRIVVINTYAVKLDEGTVVPADEDAGTDAYITVEDTTEATASFGQFKTDAFEEGDVVLYTKVVKNSATQKIVSVEKAESITPAPTGYGTDTIGDFVRIDGEKVYLSQKISSTAKTGAAVYALEDPVLYLDTFGNIIWAEAGSNAPSERTVDGYVYLVAKSSAAANALDGTEATAKYQILDLATGTTSVVNTAIVEKNGVLKYADKDGKATNTEVGSNNAPGTVGDFVGYYLMDDGSYVLDTTVLGANLSQSTSTAYVKKNMDGITLVANYYTGTNTELTYVTYADSKYTVKTVTGIENFPTLKSDSSTAGNTKVFALKNEKTNMIDKIFVYNASVEDDSVVSAASYGMFLRKGEYDKDAGYAYVFQVNGEETTLYADEDLKFDNTSDKNGIFDLTLTNGKLGARTPLSNTVTKSKVVALDAKYIVSNSTTKTTLAEGYQVIDLTAKKTGLVVGATATVYLSSESGPAVVIVVEDPSES